MKPSLSILHSGKEKHEQRNIPLKLIILLSLSPMLFFYYRYYPFFESYISLQCPFRYLTGWSCPLCGSQRALNALFNLKFILAFQYHPVLIPFLFFMIMLIWSDLFKFRKPWINRIHILASNQWVSGIWIFLFLANTFYQNFFNPI